MSHNRMVVAVPALNLYAAPRNVYVAVKGQLIELISEDPVSLDTFQLLRVYES